MNELTEEQKLINKPTVFGKSYSQFLNLIKSALLGKRCAYLTTEGNVMVLSAKKYKEDISEAESRAVETVLNRLLEHEVEADKFGAMLVVGKGHILKELSQLQDNLKVEKGE